MQTRTLSSLLSFVLLLTGCAVGVTHQLDTAVPAVRTTGNQNTFVVSTQDRRPYVLSGKKPETFVGLSRGGFGNPFDVNTASGNALATDISKAIASALLTQGVHVDIVVLSPRDSEPAALEKLSASKNKAVLVTISEWKSDTMYTVSLHYDLTVAIVGTDGRISARKRVFGSEEVTGSSWNPLEISRQAVPPALKRKLEELLGAPEIVSEL